MPDDAQSHICKSGHGHLDAAFEEDGRRGFRCKRCTRTEWLDPPDPEALALLKELIWIRDESDQEGEEFCFICAMSHDHGHAEDCRLAAYLRKRGA